MADTYVKGRLKKTDGNTVQYRLPRTSLDNIVKNASSATTYIASNNVIKQAFLPNANSATAGIVYNNDMQRLTITAGGLSINAQTDISSSTTEYDLARVPTTGAVKEYVSSVAGTGHFLDVIAKSSASSSTLIASNYKIKPDYLTSATGTSAGVVYNNDTARLTITNGGISVNAQTNITGATTTAELSKVPTTSAVKDYVSSYVEEHAGRDELMAGIMMLDYGLKTSIEVANQGVTSSAYTNKANGAGSNYTQIGSSFDHGLGGVIIGCIQIEGPYDGFPSLEINAGEEGLVSYPIKKSFPDKSTSTKYEVQVYFPIGPECNFEVVMWGGSASADNSLFYVPYKGYAIPGNTIKNAIFDD